MSKVLNKLHQVHVLDLDVRFDCGENEFVLDAMRRARCGPVHYGCFGGGCGICKMKIVSGGYHTEKRMSVAHATPEEQKEGIVLICCVKPRDNLSITRVI